MSSVYIELEVCCQAQTSLTRLVYNHEGSGSVADIFNLSFSKNIDSKSDKKKTGSPPTKNCRKHWRSYTSNKWENQIKKCYKIYASL